MRIIVTGGTGLIGSALCHLLVKENHEVIVLSRSPGKKRDNLPNAVKVVGWDAKTANGWGEYADGADAIINLAGSRIDGGGLIPKRWSPSQKQLILESRINAGKAVTEAVQKAGQKPKVVLQSSGVTYYGTYAHDQIFTESDSSGEDFLARVAVQWEDSTKSVIDMGVRHVVFRTAIVLEPDHNPLWIMALPYKMFVGGPIGSGKQYVPWIHPDDEIHAIKFLMENEATSGPYNLVAPDPKPYKDFGKAIGKAIGRPHWFPPVPAFALRLALGEISSIVLEGTRAMPKRLQEAGFTFQHPTADGALRDVFNR